MAGRLQQSGDHSSWARGASPGAFGDEGGVPGVQARRVLLRGTVGGYVGSSGLAIGGPVGGLPGAGLLQVGLSPPAALLAALLRVGFMPPAVRFSGLL